MKLSAPARSGLFPDRLVPQLSATLVALALTGCAAPSTDPASDPGAGAAPVQTRAASDSDPAPAPASDPAAAPSRPARPGAPHAAAAASNAARHPTGEEDLPEVELNGQLMFQLLASEVAAQRGELGSAATTYLAMARQTRDPRLARRATELALADRSLERALPAAHLWHELAPSSPLASQTLETLLLSTGRFDSAEPLLQKRLERARAEGELSSVYPQVQRILVRATDRGAALAMLERLAAPDAAVPEARLALAAQASAAGSDERAATEARAALKLAPDNESVAVAAAQYIAESPAGADAAIDLLRGFLARQPKSLDARFALARLLAGDKRIDEARKQFELALEQQPDSPPILFSLAQLAWQTKQPKLAEEYLGRYLSLPAGVQRDNDPAWLFLGQLAEEQGRVEEAIEHYGKVQRGEQMLPARIRSALLVGRQGRVDEARKLLQDTPAPGNRERVQLISAEAQLLRESGRGPEALELLGKALERLPENADLLYDHGMAAERVDRLDLMEASLRKLMALRPDHAHAYNALGYSLADRNVRLEEAEQLIAKALSLRPDDPHILDSMGWVRYRRGDLQGALEHLRKAWSLSPETEIGAHLGEVLWKAGRTDEARALWRDAQTREPDNAILRETLARLNVSL